MREEHLDAVLEIEHGSFPNPWSKTAFAGHLQHSEFAKYMVAICDRRLVGYTGLFFGGGQGQITNLAVHPDWRHKSIGSRLLVALFDFAQQESLQGMSLEVRVSNDDAQNLYEKFGFVKVGVRKNYYREINEDAFVMCIFNINEPEIARKIKNMKRKLDME
jgi:ribosomal-protein-alanine N-acetyltransferase